MENITDLVNTTFPTIWDRFLQETRDSILVVIFQILGIILTLFALFKGRVLATLLRDVRQETLFFGRNAVWVRDAPLVAGNGRAASLEEGQEEGQKGSQKGEEGKGEGKNAPTFFVSIGKAAFAKDAGTAGSSAGVAGVGVTNNMGPKTETDFKYEIRGPKEGQFAVGYDAGGDGGCQILQYVDDILVQRQSGVNHGFVGDGQVQADDFRSSGKRNSRELPQRNEGNLLAFGGNSFAKRANGKNDLFGDRWGRNGRKDAGRGVRFSDCVTASAPDLDAIEGNLYPSLRIDSTSRTRLTSGGHAGDVESGVSTRLASGGHAGDVESGVGGCKQCRKHQERKNSKRSKRS